MEIKNIRTYNWEQALRGMRHPKESYSLSDSAFGLANFLDLSQVWAVSGEWARKESSFGDPKWEDIVKRYEQWLISNGVIFKDDKTNLCEYAFIGPKDMELAQRLIRAGSEHRKFMRQIFVTMEITAPLYWWKEMDTYKVATVANSTSTMHTIQKNPITLNNFETDDFNDELISSLNFDEFDQRTYNSGNEVYCIIDWLESLRKTYLETKDKRYWKELIRWLPEGWLQTRTWTGNYETLLGMCSAGQRRFHKQTEWSETFINVARSLPYANEFIFLDELDKLEK